MESKQDEVLATKTKARDEHNKGPSKGAPNSAGICHDNSGRAYIIDSETGDAILLAASSESISTSDACLATLSMDSFPTNWYKGGDKYLALFVEDHSASVDWCESRMDISSDTFSNALLASSPNINSRAKLSVDPGPFILDSSAMIHITRKASNFYDLKPMPLRSIKGIGSSSINTTGVGKIC
jgi:hypothetical protein